MSDEMDPIVRPDFKAAAAFYGVSEEYLRSLPVHESDCALVTTHHLTCTCGAYRRPAPDAGGVS